MRYTDKNTMNKAYFTGLDILRFLAALGVVNFHYFLGLTDKLSWYRYGRYGNLGVQLFFMISGFVISQSVATASLKAFALGRFIRLFPIFWVLCTITYIVTIVIPTGNPVSFAEYWISMTMLGDKLSTALGYGGLVDASYWTLAVELIFYSAIGVFVFLFSWKRIRFFLWGWLAVSALSFLIGIDDTFVMKLLLVRHASYFILGASLALLVGMRGVRDTQRQRVADYILLGVTLVYSTLISFIALPPYFLPNPLDDIIIAGLHPILFGLVVLFVWLSRYLTSTRVLAVSAVIGGLTYPLYLLHQTIGNTLLKYITGKYDIPWNTAALAFEIFIIGMAYIAYRYDKRLRKYLTSKLLPAKKLPEPVYNPSVL
jgi:peptidoglycan/LPS O-acetylase OafA/YrhL